ncbi:hypothetical protein [Pararhizobium haloflavum]|uniref:hypothetical protein n=1 Tax=Pararhizobium haloflavum TaxID=2037914 RepID=UPI000C18F01C|nr:hypothetical protein [Pararhizobium haloflavum]
MRLQRVKAALITAVERVHGRLDETPGSFLLAIDGTEARLWIDTHTFVEIGEEPRYQFQLGTVEGAAPLLATSSETTLGMVLFHYANAVIEAASSRSV